VLVPAAAFSDEYAAVHSGATYFGTLLEVDEDETTAAERVWVVDYERREGKTSTSEQYFMKPPATTPPPRAKRGKRRRSSHGYRTDDSDDDDDASPQAAPRTEKRRPRGGEKSHGYK